jgi:hypothetical protein
MRILAGLFFVAAWLIPASARAVTPDELVRLRDAGLGDEVLLALVDTTGVQGRMDAAGALELKQSGLSDRVIAAAVRRAAEPASGVPPSSGLDGTAIDPLVPSEPAGSGLSEMPSPGMMTPPFIVAVPWFIVPARRGPMPARHQPPTLADPVGFGRFINLYFHPLNDGVAIPPPPDRPASHTRR